MNLTFKSRKIADFGWRLVGVWLAFATRLVGVWLAFAWRLLGVWLNFGTQKSVPYSRTERPKQSSNLK